MRNIDDKRNNYWIQIIYEYYDHRMLKLKATNQRTVFKIFNFQFSLFLFLFFYIPFFDQKCDDISWFLCFPCEFISFSGLSLG